MVATGLADGPLPALSRSTSTEPDTATNPQRPSGVAATPNGEPPVSSVTVRTEPSAGPAAVALEHPGDASARDGRTGTASAGVRATAADPEADPEAEPDAAAGADEELPDVHPATSAASIASTARLADTVPLTPATARRMR